MVGDVHDVITSVKFQIEIFIGYNLIYVCMRCPSVCLSVTFVDHVKMNKRIIKIFSPLCSHTILIFPHQTGWRYSDGNTPNGGVECRWGRQKTRFWTNTWLRYIQVYSVVNRMSREV